MLLATCDSDGETEEGLTAHEGIAEMSSVWAETAVMATAKRVAKMADFMIAIYEELIETVVFVLLLGGIEDMDGKERRKEGRKEEGRRGILSYMRGLTSFSLLLFFHIQNAD